MQGRRQLALEDLQWSLGITLWACLSVLFFVALGSPWNKSFIYAGLLSDVIGVVLLFFYPYLGKMPPSEDEGENKKHINHTRVSTTGLLLVLIGFILQFVGVAS